MYDVTEGYKTNKGPKETFCIQNGYNVMVLLQTVWCPSDLHKSERFGFKHC